MEQKKRILLVDDAPFMLRALGLALRSGDYEIQTAEDGDEAIAAARRFQPDLIFLDVELPKQDGYAVLAELRRDPALAAVHVIMLTAKGEETDEETAYRLGANEFLTKPFSPSQVAEHARAVLGS